MKTELFEIQNMGVIISIPWTDQIKVIVLMFGIACYFKVIS